jgi:hypothetical protein
MYHQYTNAKPAGRNKLYAEFHNSLKEQIPYPYKAFQHAFVNGKKTWVVYVLCPKDGTPPTVNLERARYSLEFSSLTFNDMWEEDWFNLLKLLQIAYFRGLENEYFVGRDDCYIYVQPRPKYKDSHICMQIKLSGWNRGERHLRIIGEAHTFRRYSKAPSNGSSNSETYYALSAIENGQRFFAQLSPKDISAFFEKNKPVYVNRSIEGTRTHLNYHSQSEIEKSRGFILHTFIEGFVDYLGQYGIIADPLLRTFFEFEPSTPNPEIPLNDISPIYVYDARHKHRFPIQDYLNVFVEAVEERNKGKNKGRKSTLSFVPITAISRDIVGTGTVLILQDAKQKAYEEGGTLYEHSLYKDPHAELYQNFPNIPKQFLNVNLAGDPEEKDAEVYLNYPMVDKKDLKHSLPACLNQLFLKAVILHEKDAVEAKLPYAPVPYFFIRKRTYSGNSYEVMHYFENNIPKFMPLLDEASRNERKRLAIALGINWDQMYERMLDKYKPNRKSNEEQLTSYDVILGPNLFIDLEDLEERLLYNYAGIVERQQARRTPRPIEEFYLTPQTGDSKWEEFDQVLEKVGRHRPIISLEELAEGEIMEKLVPILKVEPKDGKILKQTFMRALLRPYQELDKFPSPKDSSLHMYDGIWRTEDNCYMVGSAQTLNKVQSRAHLVRRLDVLQGQLSSQDLQNLFDAMSVQFIRLDEYTVMPYYFNLIDIFVENKLYHELSDVGDQ